MVFGEEPIGLDVFENSSHFFLVEEAEKFQEVLSDWLRRHAP
jgi:hypothetical protein